MELDKKVTHANSPIMPCTMTPREKTRIDRLHQGCPGNNWELFAEQAGIQCLSTSLNVFYSWDHCTTYNCQDIEGHTILTTVSMHLYLSC